MLIKFLKHTGAARDGQPGDPDARLAIDYLQGEILKLAARHGIDVPLTRRVIALVREAEAQKRGAPCLAPEQVLPRADAAVAP